nr:hypothetical protein [Myxococcaceae bacterium]
PPEARGSAMSLMNAAGTFGMFLGNVTAGATATVVLASGGSRLSAYTLVFVLAGLSQLVTTAVALRVGAAERTSTPAA